MLLPCTNLLSKQYKYNAFIFGLEGAYLSYVTFRAKMYKEVVGLFSLQINLSLECGSYNARQKFPGWVVLNVRPIRGIFVSGSR